MPTPTDLRAALRDRLAAAFDAAWDESGEGFNGEYTRRSFTSEMYERMRAEHIDKILADAPPTVAELLPMVDATHEVHWGDGSDAMKAAVRRGTIRVYCRDKSSWSYVDNFLTVADLTAPARLVEVSP